MGMIADMERALQAERRAKELMADFGWRIRASRDDGADFLAESGRHRYAVEVKYAKEARRPVLEGLLASAILRARAAAVAAKVQPLAIVGAPSISPALLQTLEAFARRFGDGTPWGVIDDSGFAELHGPALDEIRRPRGPAPRSSPIAPRSAFLSDLAQWMLKVILSHELPPDLRMNGAHGRIDEPIANALALAKIAQVSVASAARVVASLRHERFLSEGGPLRVIRAGELLEQWRAVSMRPPSEVRARWLFPSRDPSQQLDKMLREHGQQPPERACLGLFAACERLGFQFVSGVAPHLYLEKVSMEALRPLGLRVAEPGESAEVVIREPRFPESTFRGSLQREGVSVADVLQCWLDLHVHPARGEEMAAHLFEHVIGPHLVERER